MVFELQKDNTQLAVTMCVCVCVRVCVCVCACVCVCVCVAQEPLRKHVTCAHHKKKCQLHFGVGNFTCLVKFSDICVGRFSFYCLGISCTIILHASDRGRRINCGEIKFLIFNCMFYVPVIIRLIILTLRLLMSYIWSS